MGTDPVPRDAEFWAAKVDRLTVDAARSRVGYNISGKRVTGPQQGFGKLWQREYRAGLGTAVTPQALVAEWRAHFGDFWPRGGRFYGALTGVSPGDVAPLQVGPGIATGILVLYADDVSFSFMTPEGHMFASIITFSAETVESGTDAVINILLRASDPLWELGWPVLRRGEDAFWPGTLSNLAAAHGVPAAQVVTTTQCVDRRLLWRNWRNVRHNAAIRSALHTVAAPFRSGPRGAA